MTRPTLLTLGLILAAWSTMADQAEAGVAGESYLVIVSNLAGGSAQLLMNFDGSSDTVTFVARSGAPGFGTYADASGVGGLVSAEFAPNAFVTSFRAANLTIGTDEYLLGAGIGNSGRFVMVYGLRR